MGNEGRHEGTAVGKGWVRIPDGTKVKHRLEGYEGAVDGLTEMIAKGATLNPDRRTQYRIDVGTPQRRLAVEEDLLILLDPEGLIMMGKVKGEYRRHLTEQLRSTFAADRFTSS